ncbi:YfgC superfamily TPR repeat-containing Zn protease [Candidatus Trichorickettsia mobilis]|uniref:YfgC superfamily TPR repeat-containing Zn protease n=1 Tax=Candidatus Trichorickettsia mobilis TaxID=1346319 RepID=A0ABZ0UQZ0_9RICK|nr:M48 family metalloprotease [Candidatus Trichorickettsia mobilis]WPY00454.1 YfgC superfamily TPR repeat-containing Zn protease [Candidatus Trichorickettsia mobilis]
MLQNILLFLLSIIVPITTIGNNIIRDSEIEETIRAIADPIIRAAKLEVKIYLVNSNELNAFTAGGNQIYIYSGLISKFPEIDVIRGVIAHEIGHIVGRHVVRQAENIDIYNKVALSSIAVGLASSLSGNVELASAMVLGGIHFSERSLLSYSRGFESAADQTALRLLESSGNSCKGMISFFEYMEQQHHGTFVNPYDQTHPSSRERLVLLRNFYQKSKFKNSSNAADLEYKFARSAAKLLAFTIDPKKLSDNQLQEYNSEIRHYIKAIIYFRMSDFNNSILHIDQLLALKPNDPFYNELKGQILFEFGKKEALTFYTIAAKLRPNDLLIKLGQAIVGITIYEHQAEKMQTFYQSLQRIAEKENDNPVVLYYLAVYYEQTGRQAESLLSLAMLAYKTGNVLEAQRLARAAIKGFKLHSPNWYKANDIIVSETKEQ